MNLGSLTVQQYKHIEYVEYKGELFRKLGYGAMPPVFIKIKGGIESEYLADVKRSKELKGRPPLEFPKPPVDPNEEREAEFDRPSSRDMVMKTEE
jgi:hypothetical protein